MQYLQKLRQIELANIASSFRTKRVLTLLFQLLLRYPLDQQFFNIIARIWNQLHCLLQQRARVKKITDFLKLSKYNYQDFLRACSTPMQSRTHNYETLEVLGDTALKYITSVFHILLFPTKNEEDLSQIRSQCINNNFLSHLLVQCQLIHYIIDKKFNYRMIKNQFGIQQADIWTNKLQQSQLADIYEAILGAVFKQEYSLINVFKTLKITNFALPDLSVLDNEQEKRSNLLQSNYNFQIPNLKIQNLKMLDLNEAAFPLQEMYNNRVTIHDNDKNLDYFQNKILNYIFNNEKLLEQALTYPEGDQIGYQQLEYLGDAGLELLIIVNVYKELSEHIENEDYLDDIRKQLIKGENILCPGMLHTAKRYLLDNSLMGVLAVIKGFDEFTLKEKNEHQQQIQNLKNTLSECDLKYFQNVHDLGVNKFLGDLWESVAGAIIIDGGWDKFIDVYGPIYKPLIEFTCENMINIYEETKKQHR